MARYPGTSEASDAQEQHTALKPKIPTTEKQYGIITDLISAGEIQGLVGGLSGVYFNGISLLDKDKFNEIRLRSAKVTINGTAVTSANNMFNNVSLNSGDRFLIAHGAGPTGSLNTLPGYSSQFKIKAGTRLVLVPNGIINDSYALEPGTTNKNSVDLDVSTRIRIPGAGPDGREYVGVITNVGTHSSYGDYMHVSPPFSKDVRTSDTHTFEIDTVHKISSITNANTATLATSVTRNVTQVPATLSQALGFYGTSSDQLNYENSYAYLKRGTRYQLPIQKSGVYGGTPSASFIIAPGTELTWFSGAGTGVNVGGSSGATVISSNSFSFTQGSKEEIDKLTINIEFPGGLLYKSPKGNDGPAGAEFQIILRYKNDPSETSFQTALIHGNNYGGTHFVNSLATTTTASSRGGSIGSKAWLRGDGTNVDYQNQIDDAFAQSFSGQEYETFNRAGSGTIIKKNSSGAFIQEFQIPLDRFQPLSDWEIEIRRLTPDAALDYNNFQEDDRRATFQGRAIVKTVEAGIFDKFSYPTSAYATVTYAAEDFGSAPARAYHIKGKKVKVPSNYLTRDEVGSNQAKYTRHVTNGTDTGSYQTWNGTFRGDPTGTSVNKRKVYTNNPAWVFYDILTDKENGLGEFLEESDIDVYSLYTIARYCDELVPDGKGGQEPRFTCNVYIPSQTEAYKVIKDLSSVFRSMLYWINGEMVTVQDSPKEAVYTFTTGNVVDGVFTYQYAGDKAKVNQVNVTWNDPREFYKQTVLTVENFASIQKEGGKILPRNIVAYGTTSEGQARRLADWHLKSAELETEVVAFKTGLNAIFLRPGDIINVQDKRQHNFEASGRVSTGSVVSSGNHVIELDRTVTAPGGANLSDCKLYLIFTEPGVYLAQASATINSQNYTRGMLLLEDASGNAIVTDTAAANLVDDSGNVVATQFSQNSRVEIKDITTGGTSASSLTVAGQYSSTPQQDTIWAISRDDDTNTDEIKEFRILGLSHEEDGISITAAAHKPVKYDEIDKDVPVETTEYTPTPLADAVVPAPSTVLVEQVTTNSTVVDGRGTGMKVQVSWSTPLETVTDTAGNSTQVPYRYLSHFEVHHNMNEDSRGVNFVKIKDIPGSSTSVSINNVDAGDYIVKVRAVNSIGNYSAWTEVSQRINSISPAVNRIARLGRGGAISAPASIDGGTGLVSLNRTDYIYEPPSGVDFQITGGTANQTSQSFSALSSGNTGYMFFDASDTADPWKAVEVLIDNTQTDISGNKQNFSYIRELGASNLGLTTISGTVSVTAGSNIVTGSGTSFTTDYYIGGFILVTTNTSNTYSANSEYREIAGIDSNTQLRVKNAFTRGFSGQQARKQTLDVRLEFDAILGEVKNTGGTYSLTLFTAGKGEAGDQGDKGPLGQKGDPGAKGVRGDGGDKGDKGPKGDLGAKGVTGDGGPKGDQGDKGDVGAKGVTGDGGPKGGAGDKGAIGAKGVTGDGGPKGDAGAKGDTGAKGVTGVTGDSGDKGAKGDTGPKGTTGVKGDPGEDVFIIYYAGLANDNLNGNATVDKNNPPLAPDMNGGSSSVSGAFRLTQANGTVTNWYTSSAGLNVFFIASAVAESITQAPRSEWTRSGFLQGDKGDKGATGDKGVKGDIGQKGDQGPKGIVGDQGPKGIVGAQGAKGDVGQKGDQGAKGIVGAQGDKGAVGQKGDQGPKGITGGQGDKGAVGQKGDQGPKGITGGQGDKGAVGQKGDQGPKGTAGAKGATGAKGVVGVKGADGSPGADAPYVVIGFSSSVDTDTERNTAIKNFSGLSVVKVNSVYWDAVTGIPYQNQASEVSNPSLTALTGSSGIVNMDSIKLETGSNRVELTGNGMKIYSGNVLRVKIGDLS